MKRKYPFIKELKKEIREAKNKVKKALKTYKIAKLKWFNNTITFDSYLSNQTYYYEELKALYEKLATYKYFKRKC